MDVDESGRDCQSPSVQPQLGGGSIQMADGCDRVASDANVALVPGITGSVHNAGVLNEDVEGLELKKKA
jgi:hypothetical protein